MRARRPAALPPGARAEEVRRSDSGRSLTAHTSVRTFRCSLLYALFLFVFFNLVNTFVRTFWLVHSASTARRSSAGIVKFGGLCERSTERNPDAPAKTIIARTFVSSNYPAPLSGVDCPAVEPPSSYNVCHLSPFAGSPKMSTAGACGRLPDQFL